jgi:hypothetical protein
MSKLASSLATSLSLGLGLTAGTAFAGAANTRLDGDFVVEDSVNGDNEAAVEINGTDWNVQGGVFGTGTAGDEVAIFFSTPEPNNVNANDKTGSVRQNKFSRLNFVIESDVAARDLNLEVFPEKCKVDGKVNLNAENGNVTAKCQGDNLYANVTADQLASLQAAFLDQQRVKIKVNGNDAAKGSLSITIKGTAFKD